MCLFGHGGHGGGGDGLEHLLRYSEIGCLCYCNGTLPGGRMNLFYKQSVETRLLDAYVISMATFLMVE